MASPEVQSALNAVYDELVVTERQERNWIDLVGLIEAELRGYCWNPSDVLHRTAARCLIIAFGWKSR